MAVIRALLAMNCKDEKNILEWLLYHALLGFDRILIIDDLSEPPVESCVAAKPIVARVLEDVGVHLTIRRYHAHKLGYLRDALHEAREARMDWFLYLDADEYLMLDADMSVGECISRAPAGTKGIAFFWKCFGSGFFEENPFAGQCLGVYRRSETCCTPKLKTLAHLPSIRCALSPHHYCYDDPDASLWEPVEARLIPNIPNHPPDSVLIATRPGASTNYIAHYTHQSWTDFRHRRSRPRDDTGGYRVFPFPLTDRVAPRAFHALYNGVHTDHPSATFVRRMIDFLHRLKTTRAGGYTTQQSGQG